MTNVEGQASRGRADAMVCWAHILEALAASEVERDRALAKRISSFVRGSPVFKEAEHRQPQQRTAQRELSAAQGREVSKDRPSQGPER
jgi:hypothetical protein